MVEKIEFGSSVALVVSKDDREFEVRDIPALRLIRARKELAPALKDGMDEAALRRVCVLIFGEEKAKEAGELFTLTELMQVLKALMPSPGDDVDASDWET